MNIIVTGCNGFLGYKTTLALLKKGYNVLGISRSFSRYSLKEDNLNLVAIKDESFYSIESDIINFNPDIVLHFAWSGGNNYNDINSLDQFNNISIGNSLLNILSKLTSPVEFIGVGSFTEYGFLTFKATEDTIEIPVNYYGLAKKNFKEISKLFCSINNIKWTWIRPCYIYGEGDVTTRLLPSLISKLKNNEDVILDSCSTIIDYLHIDDFTKAVIFILNSDQKGIFNVCSGEEYQLKKLIENIGDKLEVKDKIVFDNTRNRKYSSKYICGDNSKLLSTSWYPSVSIEEGINRITL